MNAEIKGLIAKIIKRDPDQIDSNANIFQAYKVDSLLGVEILAGLDKKYGIDIPETKLKDIRTVNDIIRITEEILSKKKR
jgi:acyl carrier protein